MSGRSLHGRGSYLSNLSSTSSPAGLPSTSTVSPTSRPGFDENSVFNLDDLVNTSLKSKANKNESGSGSSLDDLSQSKMLTRNTLRSIVDGSRSPTPPRHGPIESTPKMSPIKRANGSGGNIENTPTSAKSIPCKQNASSLFQLRVDDER